MPDVPIEFVTRAMVPEDEALICNSYLLGCHSSWPLKLVPGSLYFKPQGHILRFLLQSAQTTVACFPEDPGEILGYAIHQSLPEALVLHYIYVKRSRAGTGGRLLKSILDGKQLVIATHVCENFTKLRAKLAPRRMVYDPYLIRRLMELS